MEGGALLRAASYWFDLFFLWLGLTAQKSDNKCNFSIFTGLH
jgi:hypothetical protein